MVVSRVRRNLLRWFDRHKRALPWRLSKDPYSIWVSETMLQQTTVAAVIPYFERFLARFPSVRSLAGATEDDVLALWSGLGYYSRARNLRAAARQIVDLHGGEFPRDVQEALALRGVGPYTARAVTSIAYGVRAAVVDGNVRRVIARLFAERELGVAAVQERADRLLAPRRPGDWNEAMMELGATVCLPRNPLCLVCPVASECAGRARPEYWSEGKPRRAAVAMEARLAFVLQEDSVLLERRPQVPLMAGLLDLPSVGLPGERDPEANLERRYPFLSISPEVLETFKHTITHHRIAAMVHRARPRTHRPPSNFVWVKTDELDGVPLGGLTLKVVRKLRETQGPRS